MKKPYAKIQILGGFKIGIEPKSAYKRGANQLHTDVIHINSGHHTPIYPPERLSFQKYVFIKRPLRQDLFSSGQVVYEPALYYVGVVFFSVAAQRREHIFFPDVVRVQKRRVFGVEHGQSLVARPSDAEIFLVSEIDKPVVLRGVFFTIAAEPSVDASSTISARQLEKV